jgi:hypothetical protein
VPIVQVKGVAERFHSAVPVRSEADIFRWNPGGRDIEQRFSQPMEDRLLV